jgi:hypothetical protein
MSSNLGADEVIFCGALGCSTCWLEEEDDEPKSTSSSIPFWEFTPENKHPNDCKNNHFRHSQTNKTK